ncbi:MAG: adenine deaminase [Andreesenia angusta]|nr:adenine deaminase [Andreesenia angusta]
MINPKKKADLLFKNCKIVDVFNNRIIEDSLAIQNGRIMGFGEYDSETVIDLEGDYISPSFIDAHVHIESSMVSPAQFTKTLAERGVTTIIADPHEIGNVSGLEGIEYILKATEKLPFDVYIMLPSCVPATPFETSGAVLTAEKLKKFINDKRVLGLGELMDFYGVVERRKDIVDKIKIAEDKFIDGHGPVIRGKDLDAYISAGVRTEHECTTVEEMNERISRGMYILIRQGSAAKNLPELIKGVNKDNLRRILFCTDDRHPEDLIKDGSIDNNIRMAVNHGIEPIDAIKIASLNAAEAYNLKNRGAIAPGYKADLVVFENLDNIVAKKVYKDGKLISENGKTIVEFSEYIDKRVMSKVNIREISKEDIQIKFKKKDRSKANIIDIVKNDLITKNHIEEIELEDNLYNFSKTDIIKIVVVERHTGKSGVFSGLLRGYGIRDGAIGTTIAHDSHNIIIAGDNDEDILNVIREIDCMKGGIAISSRGVILDKLQLDISGLMTTRSIEYVDNKLKDMMKIARNLGVNEGVDPFMNLAFLALPVIPDIKVTDKGLFDVINFEFMEIEVE